MPRRRHCRSRRRRRHRLTVEAAVVAAAAAREWCPNYKTMFDDRRWTIIEIVEWASIVRSRAGSHQNQQQNSLSPALGCCTKKIEKMRKQRRRKKKEGKKVSEEKTQSCPRREFCMKRKKEEKTSLKRTSHNEHRRQLGDLKEKPLAQKGTNLNEWKRHRHRSMNGKKESHCVCSFVAKRK